ncbi:hypothetical protein CBS101457_000078 [Exobasidium rhododendri]|nr:hypothetical protein CBS101457_000078 [Exobasidium rhododendri]
MPVPRPSPMDTPRRGKSGRHRALHSSDTGSSPHSTPYRWNGAVDFDHQNYGHGATNTHFSGLEVPAASTTPDYTVPFSPAYPYQEQGYSSTRLLDDPPSPEWHYGGPSYDNIPEQLISSYDPYQHHHETYPPAINNTTQHFIPPPANAVPESPYLYQPPTDTRSSHEHLQPNFPYVDTPRIPYSGMRLSRNGQLHYPFADAQVLAAPTIDRFQHLFSSSGLESDNSAPNIPLQDPSTFRPFIGITVTDPNELCGERLHKFLLKDLAVAVQERKGLLYKSIQAHLKEHITAHLAEELLSQYEPRIQAALQQLYPSDRPEYRTWTYGLSTEDVSAVVDRLMRHMREKKIDVFDILYKANFGHYDALKILHGSEEECARIAKNVKVKRGRPRKLA